jgi:hypothetical protein
LDIDEELNLVEIKIDYVRKVTSFMKQVLYPEHNVTDADIVMLNYKVIAEKYESIVMPVVFNDFTMVELQEILTYTYNKNLAIELEYIYNAAQLFSKQAYSDLKDNTDKLILIGYWQQYMRSSKFIPNRCKKEWLSN